MKSSGTVVKLLVVVLALFSFSSAHTALGAQLDLVNPDTGNPADQDSITISPGGAITLHITLTSGTDSVVSISNDIVFDTNVFETP